MERASTAAEAVSPAVWKTRLRFVGCRGCGAGRGSSSDTTPMMAIADERTLRALHAFGQTEAMSLGTPTPGRAGTASPLGLDFPQSLAVYDDYAAAQKAVD